MKFIWFALVVSLLTGATADTKGYIFVGDSRTVGMDAACDVGVHANLFVVAEIGKGHYWLVNEGLDEIERIKMSRPDIKHWVLISNLGVNDLESLEDYVTLYKSFEDEFVFVSVNPVSWGSKRGITNARIEKFNARMKSEFRYIDTYTLLSLRGFKAPDGLHYADSTYNLIFTFLCLELGIRV